MKVAMIGLRAPWGVAGGVEHAVGSLAPRLVARGCALTVYCRRGYNQLGPGLHQGVRLVDLPTLDRRGAEAFVHTALACAAAGGADLVHLHAMGPAVWSFLPRLRGQRVVVTLHGLDWDRAKWGPVAKGILHAGERSAARHAHEIIVVGAHLQDHLRSRWGRQSTWIPNGVEPLAPVSLGEGGVEGLVPGGYLLFVGRLVPEKGLERLFQAARALPAGLPIVVVGGSQHMDAYAQRLQALAPPGVRMVGPRHGAARDALLAHARALLLPSSVEGHPLAPLEAMSLGIPVWLSDIAPHREILAPAPEAGALVAEGGWTRALQQLAEADLTELRARGAAGAAHVRARCGWEAAADATMEVYRRALWGVH